MDDMEKGESTVNRMGRAGGMLDAAAPMMAMSKSRGRNFKEMKMEGAVEEQEMIATAPDESGPELVQPDVRTEFVDTAFWAAGVTTDKKGLARVDFKMPENLTAWQIRVWAMGHGTRE